MFDDPKKELQRLEEELLAADVSEEALLAEDMSKEEFDLMYDEILEEYGATPQAQPEQAPTAITPDADDSYIDYDQYIQPTAKSNRGLVIAICLESLGIVGLVIWWLVRLL